MCSDLYFSLRESTAGRGSLITFFGDRYPSPSMCMGLAIYSSSSSGMRAMRWLNIVAELASEGAYCEPVAMRWRFGNLTITVVVVYLRCAGPSLLYVSMWRDFIIAIITHQSSILNHQSSNKTIVITVITVILRTITISYKEPYVCLWRL